MDAIRIARSKVIDPMAAYAVSDKHLDALIENTRCRANWAASHARGFCSQVAMLECHPKWQDRIPDEPRTWERFCQDVLGWPPGFIEMIREGVRILQVQGVREPSMGQAALMQQRAENLDGKTINRGDGPLTHEERLNGDIITVNRTGKGTSAEYLTARIARDHPEILARMKAGEFKSVRAAALEAGIVPRTFQVPDDPVKAAKRLRHHFQGEDLATLIWELQR